MKVKYDHLQSLCTVKRHYTYSDCSQKYYKNYGSLNGTKVLPPSLKYIYHKNYTNKKERNCTKEKEENNHIHRKTYKTKIKKQ